MDGREKAAEFPRQLVVDIRLDDDPRYAGSIHDDAVAKAAGYRAALVPGAFIYGHVSRLALAAWGPDWVGSGAMNTRFRRPVYNGDRLVIDASALAEAAGLMRAEITVRNQLDEEVATGWVAMPVVPSPPPLRENLPIHQAPATPLAVSGGDIEVGQPTPSRYRVLTEADWRTSLRAFDETDPYYTGERVVHPGCLMRLAMGNTNSGFKFPFPVVLTEAEAQHFAPVRPGATLATSGRVVETFERKGKYYFVSEEVMLADGAVAARFRRTSLYATGDQP